MIVVQRSKRQDNEQGVHLIKVFKLRTPQSQKTVIFSCDLTARTSTIYDRTFTNEFSLRVAERR